MHVTRYHYAEFPEAPNSWVVRPFGLQCVNLLVGPNASGKTRILNTIAAVSKFLATAQPMTWKSGEWNFELSDGTTTVEITLEVAEGIVTKERFAVDDQEKLIRHADGSGLIWFEKAQQMIEFSVPVNTVAMVTRRDSLQHPFLELLFNWASRVRHFSFSTDLGRQTFFLVSPRPEASTGDTETGPDAVEDPSAVVEQYNKGYGQLGDDFDKAILADLARIGYECTSIHAVHAEDVPFIGGRLPVMLQVQESELQTPTKQFHMSTGMFRALAIIIHVNYAVMSNLDATILLDDIGEGLDFERSSNLINLLIEKCKDSSVQVVMTSNDRFVMNEVSLEYWHILHRRGHTIDILDRVNSKEQFENFKYLGMSNFDFFSSKAYLGSTFH